MKLNFDVTTLPLPTLSVMLLLYSTSCIHTVGPSRGEGADLTWFKLKELEIALTINKHSIIHSTEYLYEF
jgi:hypothetical protein